MYKTALIRNFSIIAHIDHGKTTLTDSFLKITGAVTDFQFHDRMMDSNPIEQEKGVTIKLAPVRMNYQYQGQNYTLNLIDTPGHVDFGYEVSRSLAACEGALLLVDATQGIQAQTLANYHKAIDLGLKIIPVVNKIDLPSADLEQTILEMMELLNINEEQIIKVSAKTGLGVQELIETIIEKIPPPSGDLDKPLRALVVTSKFDNHQGAIAYVRIVDGALQKEPLYLLSSQSAFQPIEIGVFTPNRTIWPELKAGEVGYVSTGLKDIKHLRVGDTLTLTRNRDQVVALPGFKEPQPMVFMELYPVDSNDFAELQDAMSKLSLHDAALQYSNTHSTALGNGLRVGFLGIFHAEVIRERLTREFDLNLIATAPSVSYQITTSDGAEETINNPSEMPDPSQVKEIREPLAKTVIFTPERYQSGILKLVQEKRGGFVNSVNTGLRVQLEYEIPLAELITDFHDKLKSVTSGFASMEYSISGYQIIDAVKVGILINGELIEALSFIAPLSQAESKGRSLVAKLKEVVPRQLFEIPIQAAIGGKIIARETLRAYRKDVTAKLYGGDRTRRMKLLAKQAKGKKKMKKIGKVELNQESFLAVLKS
ncbi:MAG: translation elongation factor 4 [Patescibacteria group bacterium]